MAFLRPCLVCGTLSRGHNRCEEHRRVEARSDEAIAERNAKKKVLYSSAYRKAAKAVRDAAVVCHICGKGADPADPWQADHLIPGDPASPLAAAHRSCNASRGNKKLF